MQITCFNLDLQNYIKTVAYTKDWQQPKAMTFWYAARWTLKGWDPSILGEIPELFFYKGRRFYPYGKKEWLPLGVVA